MPFTLPATLLALAGGSLAVLDHAHGWVTRIGLVEAIWAIVALRRWHRASTSAAKS